VIRGPERALLADLCPDVQRPARELGAIRPVRAMPSIAHRAEKLAISGHARRDWGFALSVPTSAGHDRP
jgi:hypothetical protein